MEQEKISQLEPFFNAEKQHFNDGFYRLRSLSEDVKELAFLVPAGCGSTAVNPQITIEKRNEGWVGTKLIDFKSTPTRMLYRDTENAQVIDEELEALVQKFERVMENN